MAPEPLAPATPAPDAHRPDVTAPDRPLRVAIVIGSTRDGRLAPTVGTWFTDQARTHAPGTHFDV
ncbi:hypothetical protein ACFWFB_33755, partial [Streptomyces albidoflavus]